MDDLTKRLGAAAHATVDPRQKELLLEAIEAVSEYQKELEYLRGDWTRLKVLYEIDGPPWMDSRATLIGASAWPITTLPPHATPGEGSVQGEVIENR